MTESLQFSPIVGRSQEIHEIRKRIYGQRQNILIITGPSGVGKTALVNYFVKATSGPERFERTWIHSLYRLSWTSTLSDVRKRLEWVPRNATVEEMEERLLDSCQNVPTLLVFDNVDEGNVHEVARLLEKWQTRISDSSIIVTAQSHVAAEFSTGIPRLELSGIKSNSAILDIVAELTDFFSEDELLAVGRLVAGNPQKLLFLSWMQPVDKENLYQIAENLQYDEDLAIEDFLESTGLPGLFLLALGIHRSFITSDQLLAFLWDNFGSGGAESYVRARNLLVDKKILLQERDQEFRLHETVHVRLEKALVHRVGIDRIAKFHQLFAEFYEQALHEQLTTTSLTHFVYHSLAAKNNALAFRAVVDGSATQSLSTRGSAVLVRQELEKLDNQESIRDAGALAEVKLLLALGGVCNDLSDHPATLRYMERATERLSEIDRGIAEDLERRIWYFGAVSFSNLGQSNRCEQEYFKIVDSCVDPRDDLACISLGYLAHDIKYRDLALALDLGKISVEWAREHHRHRILAKNLCNYAESLVVSDMIEESLSLFTEAASLAEEQGDIRELGRIEANLGNALSLIGSNKAAEHLIRGRELSSSVGDRRRQTQAILFTGINSYLNGDKDSGRKQIGRSVELLRNLHDGRYFIPALCWLLQIDGDTPRQYPTMNDLERGQVKLSGDMLDAWSYAAEHPEFLVYHEFWWRHLSKVLISYE